MIIFGIIVGIILLLCGMSIVGWIMKALAAFFGIFFDGVDNFLGCFAKVIAWIFLIMLFMALL